MFPRSAGILVHPSSFPGRYGIGDLGDSAYEFIDFLTESDVSLWQILPLGPTGYGDSPYQCFSAFAGNPLLISPDHLARDGYLSPAILADVPDFPPGRVDFGWVIQYKSALFKQSFQFFQENKTAEQQNAFADFCRETGWWLNDYALFMALKETFADQDGGVWNTWPEPIRRREPEAMATWGEKLSAEIELQKYLQFLFFTQWHRLKSHANGRGIRIIGDMPIFVAIDSAEVWANPDLFYLDETGQPTVIAGVPPDYFSETGQRWGNPLYRWDRMAANDYDWWAARLRSAFEQADIVRIDHFRGFEAYWEIPAAEPTAAVGRWVKGPDLPFFQRLEEKIGRLPIIAEDLGVITPEVEQLRDGMGFPGMKILQFGFGGEQNSDFLPHNFTANSVVYTGSHDNETTLGWYRNASAAERDHVRRYLGRDDHDIVWELIRLALQSVSCMAVIPMQDILVLGNEARMNFPGRTGGYWSWRYRAGMLKNEMADRLRELNHLYGRVSDPVLEPDS